MRSYRELWLWLGAAFLALFAAFIAIGLAYFTKEPNFSFYTSWEAWASVAVFALGFACFGCAIWGIPFLPWAKMKFPDIRVDIYDGGSISTQCPIPSAPGTVSNVPANLKLWRVRITNLENEQNASLTINLFVKVIPGSKGRAAESEWYVPDWPLDPVFGVNKLDMPIILAPGTTAGGYLACEIGRYDVAHWRRYTQPLQKRFSITDHVSGQRKDIVTELDQGNFGRANMIMSNHPGPEILEREYPAYPKPLGREYPAYPKPEESRDASK
jgi:hypothetical protein